MLEIFFIFPMIKREREKEQNNNNFWIWVMNIFSSYYSFNTYIV